MKKLWSLGILFFLIISQFQVGVIYAAETQELKNQKEASSGQLDAIGDIIETAVKKLDAKIGDEEKSQKLQNKGKEIEQYIKNAQRDIKAKNSTKDIQNTVEEVKKRLVLKVVSGVTDYENIEDNIGDDVAKTQAEKLEALEISKDSLVGEIGGYSIIMRSSYTKNKFEKTLLKLDDTLTLEYLHKVGKYRYYEVSFSEDSIFAKEMFEDIQNGLIPKSFIGIEIVKPEVFIIEQIKKEKNLKKNLLSGEDFTQTWGIEEYKTYRYFSESQKNSKKIKVGVVDTGIDYTHPDLEKRVAKNLGRDFVNKDRDAMDDQGHGTHVAGTIAASINKSGIIGVNPHVRLVPLKICSEAGFCPSYAVIRALKYAEKKNIDILNMSLGGRSNPEGHAICDAIESYINVGGIVVSAAGNANTDVSNFVPGGCDSVISVGAYDRSFSKAGFSNYGSNVDISAPGVDIYSAALGGGYKKLSGTSMSAPHITGVVSLMKSYQGDISSSQVQDLLQNNMNILVSPNYIAGAVDFDSLISSLQGAGVEEEIIVEEVNEEQEIETGIDEGNIKGETGTGEVIEIPMESYVKKDTSIDDNEPWVKSGSISLPKRQTINIGDVAEILEISSGTGKIESIDIDQEVEELKQYPESIGERVFGEDGKILENPTVIQSSESLTILEANSQQTQGFGDENWDEIETDFQVQEIRIDGAEKEIRVQGNEDLGFLEFNTEEEFSEDNIITIGEINIEEIENLDTQEINLEDYTLIPKQEIREFDYKDTDFDGVEINNITTQPEIIEYHTYTGAYISRLVNYMNYYQVSVNSSIGDNYNIYTYYNGLGVVGNQEGNIEVGLSLLGELKYILRINIHKNPEIFDLEIEKGKSIIINILENIDYTFSSILNPITSDTVDYQKNNGDITIFGNESGKKIWHVIDEQGVIRYKINVTTLPSYEIYEGGETMTRMTGNFTGISSEKLDYISYYISYDRIYVKGLKPGKIRVSINYAYRDNLVYYLNILPKPVSKKYTSELTIYQEGEVTLPENISNYRFVKSGDDIFTNRDGDGYFTIIGDRSFSFKAEQSGQAILYLYDNKNFPTYIITINSNIRELNYELFMTETIDTAVHSDHYTVSKDLNIAYMSGDDVVGIGAGNTVISVTNDHTFVHHTNLNITVLPIPDPIQINCDIYRGETCRLDYYHGGRGISYVTSRSDAFEVEYGVRTLRVKGLAVGTARVTVKARHGDYIKYIMNVNVLPQPPEIHECEIPEGTICQTYWWDDYGSYRITTTDTSVVRVGLEQYSQTFVNGTRKMERTVIEGLSPGIAEVYIYENQDHRYTVRMTVTDPVPPISVEDGSVTIKQGEKIKIEILSGGGDYMELEYEQDLIYFDVDTSADGLGDVDILGKNPGITYPKFRDKYYQEYQMSVKITDTTLDLNGPDTNNEFVFNDYQSQYISATNYYGDVYLSTSNSNFSVRKDVFDDGQIGFLITPIQNGETIFTFTDNEPGGVNTKTVLVKTETVGGVGEEEEFIVTGNLVKNPTFEGLGERAGGSYQWYDETIKGWSGMFSNAGRTKLENGRLFLETYGEGYVQTRNTKGSYHLVSEDSIKVEPNTSYIIEYDYETEYITGDSLHGFSVVVLTQEANGIGSGEFRSVPFVKTTQGVTRVKYEFTTSSNANYLNISPLIYSHTGDKTLQMKAWVDNMSLIKKVIATPMDDSQKIRYIRDWTNGSNKNTYNHWIEIQAIEFESGDNKALSGVVSGSNPEKSSLPYTKIIDGDTSSTYGESVAENTSNVIVDLGGLYNIQQVNVWHYFADSRIYNNTKTEVSVDGENWITLFDSAVDGTYVETSEGRSYEVSVVGGGSELSEIEIFLQEIFIELGIQEIQNTGTHINNSFTLSQFQQEKIDSVIQNWINTKGEEYVLGFQKQLPLFKNKEEYSSYEYGVILDYISDSIDKILGFRIIHSVIDTNNGNIGGLEFEVSDNLQGKISNIGVQYIDSNGERQRQELVIQPDGKYIVAFSADSCVGCIELKPYYLLSGRTDIFIASSENNNIEIAYSAYQQFQGILKSIWNWKGYTKNGLKDEIIDLKEDYDDYVSLIVSLFPGIGEVYDAGTLILGWDPITGENLGPISKAFTLAGLLSGFGSGKASREAGNKTLEELRKELNITQEEIEGIALEVVKDIEVNSISDLVKFKEKLGFEAISSKIKSIVYVSRYNIIGPEGAMVTKTNKGFISAIIFHNKNLTIMEVDKGGEEGLFMSHIILEQIKKIGGSVEGIDNIILDNVINVNIINKIQTSGINDVISEWGNIGTLDKMVNHFIKDTGKVIGEVKIITDNDINGGIIYDIIINLN